MDYEAAMGLGVGVTVLVAAINYLGYVGAAADLGEISHTELDKRLKSYRSGIRKGSGPVLYYLSMPGRELAIFRKRRRETADL